jgi:UDP-N-acetylglucosamine diphosphorylase/glucosamine-1-phosphate N-acetyltransferase
MQHSLFTLLLCESEGISDTLYPFSIMHSSWELRYGGRRIFEVYRDSLPEFSIRFAGRDLQKRSFLEQESISVDALSGQSAPLMIFRAEIAPNTHTVTILRRMAIDGGQSFVIKNKEQIIGVYLVKESELTGLNLHAPTFEQVIENIQFDILPVTTIDTESIHYQWDAMMLAPKAIAESFGFFSKQLKETLPGHVFALNVDRILTGRNCEFAPGIVLDASKGPIIIESDVQIMAHSFVQGPCHIGKGSIIKAGAQIYSGTVLGPVCKIGGEVEQSIFHGYANKQHQGFVGHSYVGEWVNLGALTTTSDLKNTYGEIDVLLRGKKVQTGLRFLGALIGDHTKTAIGTCLSTGTVIGIHSSIHDIGEFPPKEISSFCWGTKELSNSNNGIYELEKALAIAEIVMNRRGKLITSAQKQLFRQEFNKT